MNYLLFDDPQIRANLLPLTFTRPVSEIRCGIRKITEKWTDYLGTKPSFWTQDYLQTKYPAIITDDTTYLNGAVCPTTDLVNSIRQLEVGQSLMQGGILLASRVRKLDLSDYHHASIIQYVPQLTIISQLSDIFVYNGEQILADFQRITALRTSQPITDKWTAYYNESQIFIEEGADIKNASLNATGGPIYIGRHAQIMEGALIQGPFSILDHSVVSMGGKMRPNTSIGPWCKVGGELGGSVIMGYSNKGHEGYMGNSVIGEWCNWGAATNNSNLKNDYGTVKLHNYRTKQLEDTGRQFVGLFMGDHSKTGIGTMFNTGTVVGVSVNVFGSGLPPKHLPSFTWGGADSGFEKYRFEKAMQVARSTMERRNIVMDETEARILKHVYDQTHKNNKAVE